jgi:type IV pilus assembly protein PilM
VITDWGELVIPSGVLQQGAIVDPQQLVQVLKEFVAKTRATFVRVSLPEERAYIFETSIKKSITRAEMRNLLEFRLEENVPIPSREVLFDYQVEEDDTNARAVSVIVAAYARETVMQYHDACRMAGLFPTSFEVEAQAMARAVVPHDVTGAAMMVDFGKTRTGIGISVLGTLRFTSTIEVGGAQLSEALRKVLGDVSEAELTRIKNTEGLVRRRDSAAVHEALMPVVSVIRDELIQRMQYWHSHNKLRPERRITNIILCGGSANLRGLPEYLSETIGVPTVRANVWQHVLTPGETVPPIDQAHAYGYATAVGLALQTDI